jgi:hypothetical protein
MLFISHTENSMGRGDESGDWRLVSGVGHQESGITYFPGRQKTLSTLVTLGTLYQDSVSKYIL